MKLLYANNMQMIDYCCGEFYFILLSQQITNRYNKFVKSEAANIDLSKCFCLFT